MKHRFAFALILLVVAVLFLPALVKREVFTLRDHTDYFQPLRYFTAIHLKAFVLPHWNPYSASGEPWLSNPQTGAFYPPTWLYIVFPFETAYMLYLALHLFILGCGAYLLFARKHDAALLGAIALMVSGPVLSLLDVQNNLATFAWIPLILWAALERVAPQIAAVLLALAFLGGEPFFAAVAALMYVVLVRSLPHIAIAGAGAFGLAGIQLLPFLDWIRGSDRVAGLGAEELLRNSMRLSDWLRMAVPPQGIGEMSQQFIPVIYVGVPVVALAILGVILSREDGEESRADRTGGGLSEGDPSPSSRLRMTRGGRRLRTAAWLFLLVMTMLLASGPSFLENMPVRYPARVVPFGALAIVALAVAGWDRIRPQKRWADLLLVAVILIDLLPRMQPLLATAPWKPAGGSYPAAIGRAAKMIRIPYGPIADRDAWMAGYVNLYHRRFDAGTAAPVISAAYRQLHDTAIGTARADLLDRIGIGFVLSDRALGLRPVARRAGVTAYAREPFPPMAKLSSGRIGSLSIDTRSIRAVVDASSDGVLTISQQDSRGWSARIDRVSRKKLEGDEIFLDVAVPSGHHEVIFEYRTPSLHAGAAMTFITALSLQLSIFVKRPRTKKFSS
jgi:hypothetical protein